MIFYNNISPNTETVCNLVHASDDPHRHNDMTKEIQFQDQYPVLFYEGKHIPH